MRQIKLIRPMKKNKQINPNICIEVNPKTRQHICIQYIIYLRFEIIRTREPCIYIYICVYVSSSPGKLLKFTEQRCNSKEEP